MQEAAFEARGPALQVEHGGQGAQFLRFSAQEGGPTEMIGLLAAFVRRRHGREVKARSRALREEALLTAMDTAGRTVFFAGLTVMIALLGLLLLGLAFMQGAAIAAAL
ncbi:MAG TPA: MMPL family transporter [Solirubrobacteraceae bacterium]|nr:MMPL family transporter [Solirubrobacteraceae bacterium]